MHASINTLILVGKTLVLSILKPFYPVLFLLVWSAGYAMGKLALVYTEPLNLLAFRFAGAFLALTPLVILLRLPIPNFRKSYALMGTGLFLHIGHFGSIYVGMKLGASASIMALFAASQPVLVIIASALLARKIPAWNVWASLTLGLLGATLIIGVNMQGNEGYLLGAILGFTAVVGLSIGQVIEKQRKLGVHPIVATWVQYAFASAISIPFAFAFEGLVFENALPFWGAMAFLIFGNSIVGILLMFTMVRQGSIAKVASIMFMVPAVGALVAWLVADEVPKLIAIPGFILAMLGALWTNKIANKSLTEPKKPRGQVS
ncbi:permease of the drug/metabolite transporter superfamily protein [Glaciecola nitratireducens FR1064]|uniref:Permease of the drug/metabolite transporter superfamily protein n=2 Tax=Brumicola TaxID=3160924 RepID=G4QN25_GLANF|nr:permease of the drug/metabolite transporter superfamily protein [Glaciecola nitratireducens FR1064]